MAAPPVADAAASAASGAAKVGGTMALAAAAWGLQDWSHAASIASASIAALAGVVYTVKMVVEMYWIIKLRKQEVKRLEHENGDS